jgi:diguanylate cyclase (GGDEF)-like protein/PAS domain S-box-containing protein
VDAAVLLNALMENVADSIYFKDRERRLVWVSNKLVQDLGLDDASAIIGKTDEELFGDDFGQKTMVDDMGVMESGKPIVGLVESRQTPDGKTNWTSTSKLPIHNRKGEVIGLLGITREINELKQVEQDLQYLATHDLLTSLANRFLLIDSIEQAIRRAKRNKTSFALLYVDLDGFKAINDHYGHEVGDKVLKSIATRMTENARETDRIARLGGDEFAILVEDIANADEAKETAERLRAAITKRFDFLPAKQKITASVGICLYPGDGKSAATLLSSADHAMYAAKKIKDSTVLFKNPKRAKN